MKDFPGLNLHAENKDSEGTSTGLFVTFLKLLAWTANVASANAGGNSSIKK